MSGCEEISYPVVFKKNPHRKTSKKTHASDTLDNYDGLVSGGVYSWLSQQALNTKGTAKMEACVKEIIEKRDKDLKKLQSVLRATYTPVSDKLDDYRKSIVGLFHQETVSTKPQRIFFETPNGKRIKQRFKGPLVPGMMPKERFFVEKEPALTPALKKQQMEFFFEPIDSALAVEDKRGKELIRNIQKRHKQLRYLPFQRHETTGSERQTVTTDAAKPSIRETTRRLLLDPKDLQVIVSNTIKSLKKQPDFSSIDLEPQAINYNHLAKSLERPNIKLRLLDKNLELYQLARKPACRHHEAAGQPAESWPSLAVAAKAERDPNQQQLNVHTLPYLYVSPSV